MILFLAATNTHFPFNYANVGLSLYLIVEYSESVGITKHSTSSFSTGPAVNATSQFPISYLISN